MSAAQKNIVIDIGTDFFLTIRHKNADGSPMNLTGATFFARLRETYDSPFALADFECTVSTPVTLGEVVVHLPLESTEIIPRTKLNQYVWDYKMIDSLGNVIPKLFGNVMVRGNASAEDQS